jgi:SAM-dependent methyltransferase
VSSAVCVACGSASLNLALEVGAARHPESLIPTTTDFGNALADIARCQACGHMQLIELPRGATLLTDYAEAESGDYLAEEAGQRITAGRLLDRLEAYVEPGALLDVGCWLGFLLDEARTRGWQVVGLEPSRFASGYARDRLGLDVQTSDLFGADLAAGSVDAVVLADVIEHLPDPGQALDRITQLLRPGGVLLLVLPDAGSRMARILGPRWWSVIPTHVQYFTRRSLATLLDRHGWQLLELSTAPKAFTVRYYLERIGGYSPGLARWLVSLATTAGVADRVWTPDFRDRMSVLARKPLRPGFQA